MRGYSRAILTGNLTRDPELRTTPSGVSVCSFSVAVNRTYKDQNGEQREDVSFIDCSAWSKLGEMIAQYAKKGTAVLVSGRLDQHSWEDKTSGQKRSRVEVVVDEFNFLGSRNDTSDASSDSAPSEPAPGADPIAEGEVDLSEVPF